MKSSARWTEEPSSRRCPVEQLPLEPLLIRYFPTCSAASKRKRRCRLSTRNMKNAGKTEVSAVAESGALRRAQLCIVDPPRKGLDHEVLTALGKRGPTRLIYVSCGFPAFKRDCLDLLRKKWRLVHAEGHVLFPGADHVETLAVFDR